MVSEAVPLNKKSIGVHAIISKMKVLGNPTHYSMLDNKYQDSNIKSVTEINDLFSGDANGVAAEEESCEKEKT